MADGEDVVEGTEAKGGEWAVWDWVGEIERRWSVWVRWDRSVVVWCVVCLAL